MPSDAPQQPLVASPLFNGLRAQLIRQGRWESLEASILAADPSLGDWLTTAVREPWMPLLPYFRIMEALRSTLGDEGMAELGRERLRADLELGTLAPMLRAWVREFADDPTALMRVSPHVWSAITQHAGTMRLESAEPGRVAFRIAGAPVELLTAAGWHRLFEGFGEELMRRSQRDGSVSVSALPEESELELVGSWS